MTVFSKIQFDKVCFFSAISMFKPTCSTYSRTVFRVLTFDSNSLTQSFSALFSSFSKPNLPGNASKFGTGQKRMASNLDF